MRFLIIFLASFLFASITQTKAEIKKNQKIIYYFNKKLDTLAYQIKQKENNLKILSQKINVLNHEIKQLQKSLKNSNNTLNYLEYQKKKLQQKTESIQKEIIDFLSENYFNSVNNPQNISELISKEIIDKILQNYSKKIAFLLKKNKNLFKKISKINYQIKTILKKQKLLKNKKLALSKLILKQKQELIALKKEKNLYKQKLQNLITRQKSLQEKLKNLQIIKKRKYYSKETYSGSKTIPPIKGEIVKKFGSYIDPVYNIKIDNPSITIKPYRPNEVVRAIMDGKVVYIGESHSKKVIIIKHKNNMFSIYANLDKVSPLLKKGSIVRKGQIIARVNHSLEFEVTYKDKPINPLKVINF